MTKRGGRQQTISTYGVEIEIVGKSRSDIKDIIVQMTKGIAQPINPSPAPDQWAIRMDGYRYPWKVVDDVSLKGVRKEFRAEINSPVFSTEKELELLKKIMRSVRRSGARINRSCGVHVHIGLQQFDPGETVGILNRVIDVMKVAEPILTKVFKGDPKRLGRWAKPLDPYFIKRHAANRPRTMNELRDLWYGTNYGKKRLGDRYDPSRYHGINLHSVLSDATLGTLEFRHFNGTLDEERIEEYVLFCLAVFEEAVR